MHYLSEAEREILELWKIITYNYRSSPFFKTHEYKIKFLNREKIEKIQSDVITIKVEKKLFNNKDIDRLIKFLETFKDNFKIEEYYDWNNKLLILLQPIVAQIDEPYKEQDKKWGTYKFSSIFPYTFTYLKEVIPLIYPIFLRKKVPDPKVQLFSSTMKGIVKSNYLAIYIPFLRKIRLNLRLFYPMPIKTQEDFILALKLIDTRPYYRRVIIHEYQHNVQHKKYFLMFPFFRTNIGNIGENTVINFGKSIILMHPILFGIISKLSKNYIEFVLYGVYLRDRSELEARLAELIFVIIYDYKGLDVDPIGTWYEDIAKVEQGLKAKEEELQNLQIMLENFDESAETRMYNKREDIEKAIKLLKSNVSKIKKLMKDHIALIKEAERIVFEIKTKKEEAKKLLTILN